MFVQISEERNYWLVRTKGGELYDQFVAGDYIAIGWNEFSDLEKIKRAKDDSQVRDALKKEIGSVKNDDGEPEEKQPGRVLNQILRFVNDLKVGDVVLIPSVNSQLIEFGIIESEAYVEGKEFFNIDDGECDFLKRRKVKWVHRNKRHDLDPYLHSLFNSQHTISNANDYAHYIDRTLHRLYIKGNQAHLIIEVKKKEEISGIDFACLISEVVGLLEPFNKATGSSLGKHDIAFRANVQSPGIMEFVGPITHMIGIATVVAVLTGSKISLPGGFSIDSPGIMGMIKQFLECQEKYLDNQLKKVELQKALASVEAKLPPAIAGELADEVAAASEE